MFIILSWIYVFVAIVWGVAVDVYAVYSGEYILLLSGSSCIVTGAVVAMMINDY